MVRFGIWKSIYSETSASAPIFVTSRNISTACGFIGDGNRIVTSAGRKIFAPLLSALSTSSTRISRITAPIASSTKPIFEPFGSSKPNMMIGSFTSISDFPSSVVSGAEPSAASSSEMIS